MTQSSSSALAALGEFGLISRLTAGVSSHENVLTGIGDDAAVTELSPGMQLLTSTDMLLENVHFRRTWHDPYHLGRKSLAVSLSDIAAMGGISRWALLSLAIPADLPLAFLDDFMRGFLALASEHDIALIGGDTCSSRSGVTISVTVLGEQYPDRIVRRSGAMPDDDIWVTGTLGDAAFGLKLVEAGLDSAQPPVHAQLTGRPLSGAYSTLSGVEGGDFLISRLLDPTPRITTALTLVEAGVATAMIDVSDGILADFGHLAAQSAVGGCIRLDDIPLSAAFRAQAAQLPAIPYQLALSGGEDYELCFTAHRSSREKIAGCMKKCGNTVTRIGIVARFSGVTVVNRDGSAFSAQEDGFNHFT